MKKYIRSSAQEYYWGQSYKPYSGAEVSTIPYMRGTEEVGFIEYQSYDGDWNYQAYKWGPDGGAVSLGSFGHDKQAAMDCVADAVLSDISSCGDVMSATQGFDEAFEIDDVDSYENATQLYIDILDNYPEYQEEENLAASVPYNEGSANFWKLDSGAWKLVIFNESEYNPDTYVYENDPYWGTEELLPDSVNDIELTSDQLYSELSKLPGVNLNDVYGLRSVLDDFSNAFNKFK